jgi:hypothetical protein
MIIVCAGVELPSGRRVEPTQTADNGRLPRLREDFTDVSALRLLT